jgi:hypothetical protein
VYHRKEKKKEKTKAAYTLVVVAVGSQSQEPALHDGMTSTKFDPERGGNHASAAVWRMAVDEGTWMRCCGPMLLHQAARNIESPAMHCHGDREPLSHALSTNSISAMKSILRQATIACFCSATRRECHPAQNWPQRTVYQMRPTYLSTTCHSQPGGRGRQYIWAIALCPNVF